jgi:murein DD-endopeptidase MepM/ murein hydrolase activator NlpD
MNSAVELVRAWPWRRTMVLALITIGVAGCSAESTRFAENPYGPRTAQAEATGSVPSGQGAPVGRVETRPLPQASQLPPAQAPAHSAPVASPVAYSPASTPEITGSVVAPTSVVRKPAAAGQWNWDGGTAITVAPGETVDGIARRYGVPVSVIMEANKLASVNAIQAGQRLVIPRYNPPLAAPASVPQPSHAAGPVAAKPALPPTPAVAAPAPATLASAGGHAAAPTNNPGVHVVAPGDTLARIAHQYGKPLAEVAKANHIAPSAKLNIGDRILIPGTRVGGAKPEPELTAQPKAAGKEAAGAGPVQSAAVVTPTDTEAAARPAGDTTPSFRWPVRGRIISGFGPKTNGQQNDGIDVAVPENTPVKAAEDGVVAYAGSELKGYGNLVLVRHANGYVTAYAHAKELLVKRGDQIKRGQIIAKSGQSGNVDAPQLHFEVRKGSSAIDPMQFLNGA